MQGGNPWLEEEEEEEEAWVGEECLEGLWLMGWLRGRLVDWLIG